MGEESQVLFTVPEFARLVKRSKDNITKALRSGKLKGVQKHPRCPWRVPESELVIYWGNLYGESRYSEKDGGG